MRVVMSRTLAMFLLLSASALAQVPAEYAEKPLTRWWWFASVIDTGAVAAQLDWLKSNGFGGVEIAWVYPLRGDSATQRDGWLSPEWSRKVAFAKRHAASLGLQCDFTYGTLWPFGDSRVPPGDATTFYGDTTTSGSMRLTWEHPQRGRVVNHLDRNAFLRYSARIGTALAPALAGEPSALFCDSWEVETRKLWTRGLENDVLSRVGYDIRPYMDSLLVPRNAGIFYDYMSVLSSRVVQNFYATFTAEARARGAFSRAQCGGAPADLLDAFAFVDVPESEAVLFDPPFSRIPASAAALYGKPVVTAESFTCAYGWKRWPGPGPHQGEERVADLKLIADALFANGVNGIIWHGMPFNPPDRNELFYASVHVGPHSPMAPRFADFNRYLATVSAAMRRGRTYTDAAVYLPTEDAWMDGEYPDSLKLPWAWGAYEMRTARVPAPLTGRNPIWINGSALADASVQDGVIVFRECRFQFLYVDARYVSPRALLAMIALAEQGARIVLAREPRCPGRVPDPSYPALLKRLRAFRTVARTLDALHCAPALVEGDDIPEYWARISDTATTIFFAHPASRQVKHPVPYGWGDSCPPAERRLHLQAYGARHDVMLRFDPAQSVLLTIGRDGSLRYEDVVFRP